MADYLAITEELLSLTRSMLEGAQAADWKKVQVQESYRQTLLRRLSSSDGPEDGVRKRASANLEETAALNRRLVELGAKNRGDLESLTGQMQRGRKASLAYGRVR